MVYKSQIVTYNTNNSGDSVAVSSQFYIVHTYDSHHNKGEPWDSLLKAITPYS